MIRQSDEHLGFLFNIDRPRPAFIPGHDVERLGRLLQVQSLSAKSGENKETVMPDIHPPEGQGKLAVPA